MCLAFFTGRDAGKTEVLFLQRMTSKKHIKLTFELKEQSLRTKGQKLKSGEAKQRKRKAEERKR